MFLGFCLVPPPVALWGVTTHSGIKLRLDISNLSIHSLNLPLQLIDINTAMSAHHHMGDAACMFAWRCRARQASVLLT